MAALRLTCALILSASLQGCATGPSTRTIEWKEEVALSNGKIVIVERKEEFVRVGEPGRGSGWLFDRGALRANFGTPESILWEGSLSPLAIDQIGGQTYFVGVATRRAELEMPIRDGAFHVAMRRSDGTWHRIPLTDLPPQVEPNLLDPVTWSPLSKREKSRQRIGWTTDTELFLETTKRLKERPRARVKG